MCKLWTCTSKNFWIHNNIALESISWYYRGIPSQKWFMKAFCTCNFVVPFIVTAAYHFQKSNYVLDRDFPWACFVLLIYKHVTLCSTLPAAFIAANFHSRLGHNIVNLSVNSYVLHTLSTKFAINLLPRWLSNSYARPLKAENIIINPSTMERKSEVISS